MPLLLCPAARLPQGAQSGPAPARRLRPCFHPPRGQDLLDAGEERVADSTSCSDKAACFRPAHCGITLIRLLHAKLSVSIVSHFPDHRHTQLFPTPSLPPSLTPAPSCNSAVQMYPGEAGKVRFLSDVRRLLGLSETTIINVNFECSAPPAFDDLEGDGPSCSGGAGTSRAAGSQLSLKGLETWDAAVFCATMAAARKAVETGGAGGTEEKAGAVTTMAAARKAAESGGADVAGGVAGTGEVAERGGAAAQPVVALSAPATELGDLLSRTRELLDSVGMAAAAVADAAAAGAGGESGSGGGLNGNGGILLASSAAGSRAPTTPAPNRRTHRSLPMESSFPSGDRLPSHPAPSSTSHGETEGAPSYSAMQPPEEQPIAASRQAETAVAAVGNQRREGQQHQPEGQQQHQEQLQPAPGARMPLWQRLVQAWEAVRPCFC